MHEEGLFWNSDKLHLSLVNPVLVRFLKGLSLNLYLANKLIWVGLSLNWVQNSRKIAHILPSDFLCRSLEMPLTIPLVNAHRRWSEYRSCDLSKSYNVQLTVAGKIVGFLGKLMKPDEFLNRIAPQASSWITPIQSVSLLPIEKYISWLTSRYPTIAVINAYSELRRSRGPLRPFALSLGRLDWVLNNDWSLGQLTCNCDELTRREWPCSKHWIGLSVSWSRNLLLIPRVIYLEQPF